jgi:hypothetical protein
MACAMPWGGVIQIDSRCAPLIPETSLVVHRPGRTVGFVWAGLETDAKLGEWKTLNRFDKDAFSAILFLLLIFSFVREYSAALSGYVK